MNRSLGWLMAFSSCAAFAQTPNAPVLTIGNGFFSDPYGSYSCYVADTKFTGTNGANTTVSWNGGSITAPTYSTLQAAISAAAAHYVSTSVPSRACLLAGETYVTGGTPNIIDSATGGVATAAKPFVIQGDPAATASTMPVVSGNGGAQGGFNVGSGPAQSTPAVGYDNRNTVIRKIEITNFVSTGSAVWGVSPGTNFGGRYDGLVVEYSKLHLFRAAVGPGGSGPVYTSNPNTSDHFEVRYSKMYDNLMTDGTTQGRPFAAVETYGGVFSIHHNEIYAINTAFAGKVLTPATPNGSFYKNLVHDVPDMIEFEAGGEGPGINGIAVYGNLFYWTHYNDSVFGSPGSASVYNDYGSSSNTTAPTNMQFYNNTVDAAIGSPGAPDFWNHNVTNIQFYNNIVLGSTPLAVTTSGDPGTYTLCDYNFYFNPSTFFLNAEGSPASVGSFTAWQSAHTTYSSFAGLSANPDAHGGNIAAFSSSWTTVAANFPNASTYNYTIASGSPLKGAGQGGVDPGYNPNDVGPGW